jgi:hypothetical protein
VTNQGFEQTRPGYPPTPGQPSGSAGYPVGAAGYGAAGYPGSVPSAPAAAGYGEAGSAGAAGYIAPPEQFSDAKGFAASLFDFGFTSFVTPKVVKVVYVLIMIMLGFGGVASAIIAFEFGGSIAGIFTLVIVVPLVFLVYLSLWRIALEIFVVIFRLAEDVRAIRERGFR